MGKRMHFRQPDGTTAGQEVFSRVRGVEPGHGEADLTHPENTSFGKLAEHSEWENNQAKRMYVRLANIKWDD